jgi:3-oxoacyl-[acyl-carrier protein] reductase
VTALGGVAVIDLRTTDANTEDTSLTTANANTTTNHRLKGKVALVTGASQGIGRATAIALSRLGASVIINYNRETDSARALVGQLKAEGRRALALQSDIRQVESIRALFKQAIAAFGGLDIVVSNAGAQVPSHPIADVSEEEFDLGFSLNGRSHFFMMQMAARTLRDGGRVILTSSSTTAAPFPGSAVYAGAKAAAEIYVRVLAKELGSRGITVNAVSPGLTDTAQMRAGVTQERVDAVIRMTPLGRPGLPEDIADVIAFLATDEARWITGQNIRVGGGIV